MNEEKQIEEMARIASKCITNWLNNETPKPLPDYIAEVLYNACYRKASEVAEEVTEAVKKSLLAFHLDEDRRYNTASIKTNRQMDIATARFRAVTDTLLVAVNAMIELKKKYTKEK